MANTMPYQKRTDLLRLALLGDSSATSLLRRVTTRLDGVALIDASDSNEWFAAHGNEIDAVVIHSSIKRHEEQATRAARAGKHVLVQSPLAGDVDSAQRIVSACKQNRVCLMVGSSLRFHPAVSAIYESLQTGQLGDPGLLRIHRWQSQTSSPGYERLVRQLVNEVDLACWIFGVAPSAIYAAGGESRTKSKEQGYFQLHLGFDKSGMALIDIANFLPEGEGYFSLSLIGSRGAAYADDHRNMHLLYAGGKPSAIECQYGDVAALAELTEFVRAIDQQRVPSVNGADAIAAIEIVKAAVVSWANGQPVGRTGDTNFELNEATP